MIDNIKKICIIGGPGTGKSTLARNIGKKLNLPVYHIDAINYLDNWKQRNKVERDKIILETTNQSSWVMDGTYIGTLNDRINKSDCVIFLDYTTIAQLKGIILRFFKDMGKEKQDIPGCKEHWNFWLFKYTIKWNYHKRKAIMELLELYKDKKILIFKNRTSLNKWYQKKTSISWF